MRALVVQDGRWAVREVDRPVPAPHEVLVGVRAAGLNRADLLARDGSYLPEGDGWRVPLDRVGFEAAGVVTALGREVTGVRVGDRVAAQTGGAAAEVVAVDAQQLLRLPDAHGWHRAAATPSAALTAFDALTGPGDLRAGGAVLVTSATSGVGLVTVQVARALGAGRVVGTTRDPARREAVLAAGADAVVVAGGSGGLPLDDSFDVVVDLVGGPLLARALPAVTVGGRVVQVGRLGGGSVALDLELLARRRLTLVGTTFRGRGRDELRDLVARLVRSGVLSSVDPPVTVVVPLDDAEVAAGLLASGTDPGKMVLEVRADPAPQSTAVASSSTS